MKTRRFISLLMLTSMLASLTACGEENPSVDDTIDVVSGGVTTPAAQEYVYDKNFGGKKFRILSTEDGYTMHMQFDREESNGEALNDAIYNRNRLVEEKLGITIEENAIATGSVGENNKQIAAMIRQNVEADDDFADLTLIPPAPCASSITGGYFYDLNTIDSFKLDEKWYNQSYNSSVELNGKLFFGMSEATVGLTDGIWAIFINEDMLEDLKLDKPYNSVREGKWTIDVMKKYMTEAASLNGDDSFTWNKDGNSRYGLTSTPYLYYRFTNCFDERFVENDGGKLKFTAGSERFYDAVDALYAISSPDLGLVHRGADSDYDPEKGGYVYPFMTERALFLTAEICKTQKYREFDFTYGILPFPKLDESQENYVSTIYQEALAFSVPITCETPEDSGIIYDALSYEGMKSVVPTYREITVEQKGLRNEDSIAMLEIITSSAYCDVGAVYGLTGKLVNDYYGEIRDNNGTMSSIIAQYKTTVEAAIKNLEEQLK